jgi:Putative peptidoglycan binding domain/L,D-transpeptidase catalytic domain
VIRSSSNASSIVARVRLSVGLLPLLLATLAAGPLVPAARAQTVRPGVAASSGRRAASTLSLGSHGSAVRTLQSTLARLTYLPSTGIDGVFGVQTWHAVVAFQGWSGLVRDGVVGPRTRQALDHAHRPVPWSTATGFEVHVAQQVLLLVRDGRVQRTIHVSTGRPGWPTPIGHFTILERALMSWSAPFEVWMPLAQYFYDGYALHEFSEVQDFPASHRCVRVPKAEAQTVWSFGRIGMRVWTTP